jgi:hypothetical protein
MTRQAAFRSLNPARPPVFGSSQVGGPTAGAGDAIETITQPITAWRLTANGFGAVYEGVKSCPRAGWGKSACPVRRFTNNKVPAGVKRLIKFNKLNRDRLVRPGPCGSRGSCG